jgi:protein Tex
MGILNKNMDKILNTLSKELGIKESQIQKAVGLLDEGNTVPFVARYRKEVTGGLTDEQLRDINDRLIYLRSLEKRKGEVVRLIDEQGKLTDELSQKITFAKTLTEVEDLYRPYKKKRVTRASKAKEKGLEPLAHLIIDKKMNDAELEKEASAYIDKDKGVDDINQAIEGAKDIVAEIVSDDADLRKKIRMAARLKGSIKAAASTDESTVYDMYYDFSESVANLAPHRILALNRAEKEKVLSVKVDLDENACVSLVKKIVIGQNGHAVYENAIEDAYKRLIFPSTERDIRNELTEKAEEQAIKIFAENLKGLLLTSPVKGRTVMGLDPGYRTGNKVAVVDQTGKVLDTGVVYMTLENHDLLKAKDILTRFINKHNVDIVAIGNGTASKETEIAVADLIKEKKLDINYIVVSESGASIYSASKLASAEFPEYDVSLRSAVSIARRLQDPLAELVKIDPKSIGVGQYQHDVNQKRLNESLGGVVEYCVNEVGVDLNTASPSLLKYIAGISTVVSNNIVDYRNEIGGFENRKQLLKVAKLGPKVYEQCAGFLRIPNGDNILDNTSIHPESYKVTTSLLKSKKIDLNKASLEKMRDEINTYDADEIAKTLNIGKPTLVDILSELKKPGRDLREDFEPPILKSDIMHLEDLTAGLILTGTVRNVVDFGAFVDIGVHQDGLVHISELSNTFIKHPLDAVKVGDVVQVKVLGVETNKKRISLTMKNI